MKKRFAILGLLPLFVLAACDKPAETTTTTPATTESKPAESTTIAPTETSTTIAPTETSTTVVPTESTTETGGFVDVPTEEGKTTVYFTLGDGSVEFASFVSVFCTGNFNEWATSVDGSIEFEKLEDSNIYYGFYAFPEDGDYEFQLTLGYNATSGAPSTGVNWSFKSAECQAASGESGTENLSFTVANGLADLGTHTFDAQPGTVKLVNNLTVTITLADAVPEYVTLYMPGNWRNNWACTRAEDAMIPSADRKTWSASVASIVGNTYEAKIVADATDGAGEFGWNNVILDNGAGGNYTLMVLSSWGDNYTLNINELDDIDPIEFDFSVIPDPAAAAKRNVTVVVESPVALTYTTWKMSGSFNAWGTAVDLVASNENKTFTAVLTDVLEGSEIEYAIHEGDWHVAIKALDANGDFENFKTAINLEGDVTITITLTPEGAADLNTRTAAIDASSWLSTAGTAVAALTVAELVAA